MGCVDPSATVAQSSTACGSLKDPKLNFVAEVPFRTHWRLAGTDYLLRSMLHHPQEWEILRELNMANFGRVSLVRHIASDIVMAVKIMGNDARYTDGSLATTRKNKTGVVERLQFEEHSEHMVLEIGASYYLTYKCADSHGKPFVLQMLGVWMDDKFLTFATEACIDELFNVIKSESLPDPSGTRASKTAEEIEQRNCRWAYEMFSAVAFLHRNGVAHRDISLENILLHSDGSIRVMDFGLAVDSNVRTIGRVGKTLYRPPEMYCKAPYCPKAVDIFMCGVVLFIMITGRPMFVAAVPNDPAYGYIRRNGVKELIRHWKMEYTAAFDLVSRCICHLPEDRIHSDEILRHSWFDSIR